MRSRILVVEEPNVADTLADYLRLMLEECEVETAFSPAGAMLQMEQGQFSLALVKLGLPDGGGLHLLRLLKAEDPSLEVIIMTGGADFSLEAAIKQGAFHVLFKPFDLDAMLLLVGKAMEHRRLVAENSELRRKLAERYRPDPTDPPAA